VPDTQRLRRFAQPYPAGEALDWLVKNLAGPPRRPIPFTPVGLDVVLNPIVPALNVAFIGDILPVRHVTVNAAPEARAFMHGADWLVGNLEGPVVDGRVPWVFMGQPHTPAILDLLATLAPPERTVLLCAKNHAADYGRRVHERSLTFLHRHGILCAGDCAEPTVALTPEGGVTAGTAWSNHRQDFLAPLPAAPPSGFALAMDTSPSRCRSDREWSPGGRQAAVGTDRPAVRAAQPRDRGAGRRGLTRA
jgi:hypothetical protein